MKPRTKRRLAFLAGFCLYFGVLWYFWYSPVVWPLKIFVVFFHELSHAMAVWLTGGVVDRIVLDAAQGGFTEGKGGIRLVALSAGYLGSLAWGALLVMAAVAQRNRARWVNGALAALLLGLTVLTVEGSFGVVFGLAAAAALGLAAWHLSPLWNARIVLTLGLTSCLYAVLDIKSDVLDRPHLPSDAAMLADLTGVPTAVWGVTWIALAVAASALLFRWAYRRA